MNAARALETLGRTTEDKSTVPIFWDSENSGILKGKRGRVHHVVIPVSVPIVQQDCLRLRVMGDGRMLGEKEQECHSPTRNFYNWICSAGCAKHISDAGAFQDGSLNGLDTGNNLRSGIRCLQQTNAESLEGVAPYTITNYGYVADEAWDTSGIVVGTGDAAFSFDGFALQTQIAHGVGAGELYHAKSPLPPPDSFSDGVHSYPLSRYFDNFEAGTGIVTIKEVSQYAYLIAVGVAYPFMVARDLIDGGLEVPFRAILEVTYTYSLAYSGSGSPLRNYYNFMMSQFASLNASDGAFEDGSLAGKTTVGGYFPTKDRAMTWNRLSSPEAANQGFRGNDTGMLNGVFAGSGNTGVQFDDYALDTVIDDGTDPGELDWQMASAPTRSWADPVMTITHTRDFNNSCGVDVTVRELGLVGRFHLVTPVEQGSVLCFRDVFSDEVIPDGDVLRGTYQLNVNFPS